MKTWILPVDGTMFRVVLEKDTLDIWVNGTKVIQKEANNIVSIFSLLSGGDGRRVHRRRDGDTFCNWFPTGLRESRQLRQQEIGDPSQPGCSRYRSARIRGVIYLRFVCLLLV